MRATTPRRIIDSDVARGEWFPSRADIFFHAVNMRSERARSAQIDAAKSDRQLHSPNNSF